MPASLYHVAKKLQAERTRARNYLLKLNNEELDNFIETVRARKRVEMATSLKAMSTPRPLPIPDVGYIHMYRPTSPIAPRKFRISLFRRLTQAIKGVA